ncbi:hypothetical protein [Idiomarina abyssalis]|uniref:hypothetical protein n=1 Tax=Idiomarina abyssalis TaxID=86102 RepID=UPI003A8FD216
MRLPKISFQSKIIINLGLTFIVCLAFFLMLYWGVSTFPFFVLFFLVSAFTNFPKSLVSPLSFFYLYYISFYVVAPLFAERYQLVVFEPCYSLAFILLYVVFSLGQNSILMGEKYGMSRVSTPSTYDANVGWLIAPLFFLSTLMCVLIVINSGGFDYWIDSPGQAFLNRGGTGHFVILSHFFSIAMSALVGFYVYKSKRYWVYIIFLIWFFVTSPVHGSKMQLSLLILLSIIPWLRNTRVLTLRSISVLLILVLLFFLGLYFRNNSWLTFDKLIPYALNYFTALENLAISLRDFEPMFMHTFLLPFNKFLTPFGLSDSSLYYDMNHYLTDIYFPENWEVRATEQWPVETDLYLNFYFVFGLPLVCFYLFFVGYIYGRAKIVDTLGYWMIAFLMTIFLISHLRGSLYNHVDFYMYPYMFIVWFSFRRYSFKLGSPGPKIIHASEGLAK